MSSRGASSNSDVCERAGGRLVDWSVVGPSAAVRKRVATISEPWIGARLPVDGVVSRRVPSRTELLRTLTSAPLWWVSLGDRTVGLPSHPNPAAALRRNG